MQNLIEHRNARAVYVRMMLVLSFVLVCGILTAGLWPFHAPANAARWLEGKSGIQFEPYATVVSERPLQVPLSTADSSCTLEIWLTPGLSRKGTVLAFADSTGARAQLALRQVGDNLALERQLVDQQGHQSRVWMTIENVLRDGPALITITSGERGTLVYRDGVLAESTTSFGLQRRDLTGDLVLGTSSSNDSWSGNILELAIASHELTPAQVAASFHLRTSQSSSGTQADSESWDAEYLFSERRGSVVHGRGDSAPDLRIPRRYSVLHRPFLQPPWYHYRDRESAAFHSSYWLDVGVNIAGFIPVGFCFAVFFCTVARVRHPLAATIFSGFALSLMIEVLQAWLPTRNSGLTDVITNTLGTAVGVALYYNSAIQAIWSKTVTLALGVLGCRLERASSDRDAQTSFAA